MVERRADGSVLAALSIDGFWLRPGRLPALLAVEIAAQAAALVLPADDGADSTPGYLAGLSDVELLAPLTAGDCVTASARAERRFGPLLKVAVELRRDGEPVLRGGLLLATGGVA